MKKSKALLLAFLLLVGSLAGFSRAEAKDAVPLRVLLRRLGITNQAVLNLEGTYLAKGGNGIEILFGRGIEVTAELREGEILLFHAGAAVSVGKSVTLVRQEDRGGVPGMYINQAGLYPGDLSLTVREGSLQPVLSLSLEEYLPGVVPYEMSDSFPLEALKAQAVCARTYAMRKIGSGKDWDVVDTTNDQVFRGVSSDYVNAAQAVSETSGLVLTRGGKLVEGYYSASNGGQTELPSHVWGGSDTAGRYEIREDLWDAENPESLTRSAEIPKDGNGLYRRMTALLREAVFADPQWKSGGFSESEADFRIDWVSGMALKTPRYEAPSRLMTELEMTLLVSGRRVTGGTLGPFQSAGTFSITLQIFPDVINALGLSISGQNNEIITLSETETTYVLNSGRYGHGVGLSQRGAEYMAKKDGKTFDEILAFYYPDSEIMRYEGEIPALPVAPERLAASPEPTASPTPGPTLVPVSTENLPEGAYLASVENIQDGTTLNLRAEPSPASAILGRLCKHQLLIVLDELDVPGWAHVKTDAAEGYVASSYLEKTNENK